MNILVTGAEGFLGKNLIARIEAESIGDVFSFDLSSANKDLEAYVKQADFIFHFAGVNRTKNPEEFYLGNYGLTETLVRTVESSNRAVPIVFSSTTQVGNGSDYAKSKEMAEKALFGYAERTGAYVFTYRFPGIFGKWSHPNHNTVIATFCHNISHGLPIEIHDPDFELTLCYVDDIISLFIETIAKKELLEIAPIYRANLKDIATAIRAFAADRIEFNIPNLSNPFIKKLYATYLSFLPESEFSYPLKTNRDVRGSFTEFIKMSGYGQVSVNASLPGIEKGNHWHSTKHEKFLVVCGQAAIRLRRVNDSGIVEYFVSGDMPEVVDIPPGYTHSIINTGDTILITVMWANEIFSSANPDTYYEKVEINECT